MSFNSQQKLNNSSIKYNIDKLNDELTLIDYKESIVVLNENETTNYTDKHR